ncbi:bidirectional hydrogenase complex protein HoxE [Oscillochloris sp. ZM17-4]|uniref:bidirectional hydrogenase complex protein HoxE n=1 Tax=Oscillochloris sp. ZM17-4 TaxID=2866714 RepID=UPI001C72F489|nr:bidirectional hydrogenase complex protein HoxE [Oscillochloris sp. ZM17-4]MBX0326590.1 bidirectional hydrogenase complex protein HoxE [Oscillochloris sp. ZM17-4]
MATPPLSPRTRGASANGGDNRLKILEATMKRNQYRPDALIEVLHKAQELYGFLSPALLTSIARSLRLPPSRVYGVATFYHFFSLAPQGEHTCTICLGTACYVRGAGDLMAAAEAAAGVGAGKTTADGRFSLASARCLGACGIAPAIIIDGVVAGHASPEDLAARLTALLTAPSED